jgi:hypothetical protein
VINPEKQTSKELGRMRKQQTWKCVAVGTKETVENMKQSYNGRGYFITMVPRTNLTLDGTTEMFGLYVRKATLADFRSTLEKRRLVASR